MDTQQAADNLPENFDLETSNKQFNLRHITDLQWLQYLQASPDLNPDQHDALNIKSLPQDQQIQAAKAHWQQWAGVNDEHHSRKHPWRPVYECVCVNAAPSTCDPTAPDTILMHVRADGTVQTSTTDGHDASEWVTASVVDGEMVVQAVKSDWAYESHVLTRAYLNMKLVYIQLAGGMQRTLYTNTVAESLYIDESKSTTGTLLQTENITHPVSVTAITSAGTNAQQNGGIKLSEYTQTGVSQAVQTAFSACVDGDKLTSWPVTPLPNIDSLNLETVKCPSGDIVSKGFRAVLQQQYIKPYSGYSRIYSSRSGNPNSEISEELLVKFTKNCEESVSPTPPTSPSTCDPTAPDTILMHVRADGTVQTSTTDGHDASEWVTASVVDGEMVVQAVKSDWAYESHVLTRAELVITHHVNFARGGTVDGDFTTGAVYIDESESTTGTLLQTESFTRVVESQDLRGSDGFLAQKDETTQEVVKRVYGECRGDEDISKMTSWPVTPLPNIDSLALNPVGCIPTTNKFRMDYYNAALNEQQSGSGQVLSQFEVLKGSKTSQELLVKFTKNCTTS